MVKREFTSFDVAAVTRELREQILDSRVSNVYQIEPKTVLLKLHKTDKPPTNLLLEAGRRIHLTYYQHKKPQRPPAFCMALRKYLRGSWLTGIEQYEFERTVIITFKAKTTNMTLIVELFGEGNLILTDQQGKILQALIYKRMRDRNVLRDANFVFAPQAGQNPFKVKREELQSALQSSGDTEVVRALARLLSVGGFYAEEILLRTQICKTRKANTLSETEIDSVYATLQLLLSQVTSGKLEPSVILDENDCLADAVPFQLKRYESTSLRHQYYPIFNEALDELYTQTTAAEEVLAKLETDNLKREVERLERIIKEQQKTLAEASARTEQNKGIADSIYTHANELQILLGKFLTGKKNGRDWKAIVSHVVAEEKAGTQSATFFDSFDAKTLVVNISLGELRFGLSLRKSVFDNATSFYERYKREKQRLDGAAVALQNSNKRLAEAEAKLKEAKLLEQTIPDKILQKPPKARRKEWFEKFRWFISSDGFQIVAGKDAVSNEVLIKKYTEDTDIVFHADIIGAPFVVVKTKRKNPNEQCLREAAEFAAAYSRGWREGFGSVDTYWVSPNQLSKGGPSGESVPHGAFAVLGKRNWIRGIPLRLAIGIVTEAGDSVQFVGGPVESVKAKANLYVIVMPGDLTGKELFRRILLALARKAPKHVQETIRKASFEEIREFVPFNKGKAAEN